MKEFWKNPREISEFELKRLGKNIEELGDLSGITHDVNTDEIITGNQRVKAMGLDSVEPVITHETKKPDKQGTLAVGYFELPDGGRMNYRRVKWTKEQCDKANITANKLGGVWDMDVINNPDLWDKEILIDSGFEAFDLDSGNTEIKTEKETTKKTKTTKFFTFEVLFPNKEDYIFVTEVIDKSKLPDETIPETLKRLLKEAVNNVASKD